MDDELDELLQAGKPRQVTAEATVMRSVDELVRSTAEAERVRRPARARRTLFTLLASGVIIVGATAAAIPLVVEWATWQPDAYAELTFSGVDGGERCEFVVRAVSVGGSDADVELARRFLQEHDWSTIEVTKADIAEMPAERRVGVDGGEAPEAALVSRLLSERVNGVWAASGFADRGVALESQGGCGERGER